MNRAALTLGIMLVVAVSLFVGGLGFAFSTFHQNVSSPGVDEVAFRREFGEVNVSSPVYSFSPPVPMYHALRMALENDGWNQTSLSNMTVYVSLGYFEFTENGLSSGSRRICKVTQPVASYEPVFIQNGTSGTIAYRYIWDIVVTYSSGLIAIPPPGLYWVDAANSEVVSTGIIF